MESLTLEKLNDAANGIFAADLHNLIDLTFGGDRLEIALDLEGHPTQDLSGGTRTCFELEQLFHRCFEFAVEAKQGSDDSSDHEALDALLSMSFGRIPIEDSELEKNRALLDELLLRHEARLVLEYGEPEDTLSRTQIAFLGKLAVETVRLAGFAKKEECLPQERPGVARVADVKRWLIHKNRYEELERLPPSVMHPNAPAKSDKDLSEVVRLQAMRLLERTSDVKLLLPENSRPGFCHFYEQHRFDPNDIGWVTPGNAATLASNLQIEPKWLFENLDRLAMDSRRQALLSEMDDKSLAEPLTRAPHRTVVNREMIRAVLAAQSIIDTHPAQRKPNSKLDGYLVRCGLAFAHQHDGKAQFFWVPEHLEVPDGVTVQHYPAVAENEPVARHSGLIKFPELGRKAVKKIRIKDSDVLNAIVGRLVGSQDVA